MACSLSCRYFIKRYNSDTKRSRFSPQRKALKLCQFRNDESSHDEALKKWIAKIEILSFLAQNSDKMIKP